ncbi:uncharacterized protein METZ01_LOCUS328709, partial [marine metagenome]
VLAKYTDDEIIQLVRQNPGYGLLRMVSELYPTKNSRPTRDKNRIVDDMMFIFQEHNEQTGEDPFDLIQSTEFSTMVTEAEYLKRTGKKYLPKGAGRTTGKRKKRSEGGGQQNFLALPPQRFNWGEIEPAESRPSHIEKGFKHEYTILNLRFPFSKFWEMWMDGYSRGEIS